MTDAQAPIQLVVDRHLVAHGAQPLLRGAFSRGELRILGFGLRRLSPQGSLPVVLAGLDEILMAFAPAPEHAATHRLHLATGGLVRLEGLLGIDVLTQRPFIEFNPVGHTVLEAIDKTAPHMAPRRGNGGNTCLRGATAATRTTLARSVGSSIAARPKGAAPPV